MFKINLANVNGSIKHSLSTPAFEPIQIAFWGNTFILNRYGFHMRIAHNIREILFQNQFVELMYECLIKEGIEILEIKDITVNNIQQSFTLNISPSDLFSVVITEIRALFGINAVWIVQEASNSSELSLEQFEKVVKRGKFDFINFRTKHCNNGVMIKYQLIRDKAQIACTVISTHWSEEHTRLLKYLKRLAIRYDSPEGRGFGFSI